jgi:DNA mismatch repair protein MSH4
VIQAHIGCYVPAEYASFRPSDAILTRLSNNDSLETNTSTFLSEMQDMSFILKNATDQSVILVDELGRGTSTFDGLGITCAICEKLLESKVVNIKLVVLLNLGLCVLCNSFPRTFHATWWLS